MVKVFKPIGAIGKDTIREQQKDYYKNLLEFAALNYQQITAWNESTGVSAVVVYTVPADKILYLTSLIHSYGSAAGNGVNIMGTNVTGGELSTITWTTASSQTIVNNFSMPIKIQAGVSIILSGVPAGHRSSGWIAGFLVPFLPNN